MIADNWNDMLADIKKTEESINKHLSSLDSNTLEVIDDTVSKLRNQADESLALLMETKARVEARTPFDGLTPMLIFLSRI